MAKGSLFTTFSGKIGQVVGFINRASNNGQVQGLRAYQPSVSNPKSIAQANQRLVLKPVNSVYRQLSAIIDRSFEGVTYGAQSRNRFLQLNMANFNGPYLVKGDETPVPGPMTISQGSLVPIAANIKSGAAIQADLFESNNDIDTVPTTMGQVSARLMANATDIQSGDQITCVYVVQVGNTQSFIYRSLSFYIDPNSEVGSDSYERSTITFEALSGANPPYRLTIYPTLAADEVIVAGAWIQSRDGAGSSKLRSTAVMTVTQQVLVNYFNVDHLQRAIASYTDSDSKDWPVDPSNVTPMRSARVLVNPANLTQAVTQELAGFVTEGNGVGLYLDKVANDYYVLTPSLARVPQTGGEAGASVKLSAAGIAAFVNTGLWAAPTSPF